MKKKPVYRYGMPKGIETKGTANGEVTTYIMNPVELANWRRDLPKVKYEFEKNPNPPYGGDIA